MKKLVQMLIAAACLAAAICSTPAAAARVEPGMTVLITGANRGIGFEFARQLSQKGYRVIGTARTPGDATALQNLDVRIVQLDVADSASVEAMANELEGVPVDILINNAGIAGHGGGSFTDLEIDKLDRTLQVNSLGPMRVTQALYDNLLMGEGRTVIQITSMMGSIEMDTGGFYGYRMSKAALNMFNKTLSLELAGKGYICVLLHPGWVQTDLGGEQAPLAPKESISGMINVIEGLDAGDNGRFYDYQGKELPW